MTALEQHLDDYLAVRRGLGFKLTDEQRMLTRFVAFLDDAGERRSRSTWRCAGRRCRPASATPTWRNGCARCVALRATCTESTRRRRSRR
jgi:hypothetical protein